MSFGLSRGKPLDISGYGLTGEDLPALPDDLLQNPEKAWVDPREWFEHPERPFELEIGSGKGTFLAQQAGLQPETNFLGIEWAKEFFAYAADRMRRNRIDNVRMLHFDASEFVRWRVPTGIVKVLHLYFADPWPKPRHHKRRMVQDQFLAEAFRIIQPGGELRIVTDHAGYWSWMEEHFARWCEPGHEWQGKPMHYERHNFERPASAGEGEVVGTNFERKYIAEGRTFNAAILVRPADGKIA
ncbi:MAG: tRNA (guanosine(46)-N7)-methyltransferase TrmB [Phycisphaerales bacterium JB050]